jgi:carboxyl-terminal processing protease
MSVFKSLAAALALSMLTGSAWGQFKTGAETTPAKPEFSVEVRGQILDGVTDILKSRAFVPGLNFDKWEQQLATKREELIKIESENAFASGVNQILREFGISHVGLRTPRSADFRRTGMTTGLGMGAQFEKGAMVVRSVAEGSPAAQAGLQVGDKIVEINGAPVKEDSRLQQDGEAPLNIKYVRAEGEPKEAQIKAAQYQVVNRDRLTWVNDKVAMLRINSFSRGYEREAIDKMMVEAAKAEAVIVDLRNNGGGAVTNLAHLLGLFIDANEPVGTFVNRQAVDGFLKAKGVETADVKSVADWSTSKYRPRTPAVPRYVGKVAVLINRGSASASEIFAAAMKEVRGSAIVGTSSRGAVLASTYGRLAGGFEMQFPVSDYVTIRGQRLEGDPVKPTIEVSAQGNQAPVDAAVEALIGNPLLAIR